MLIKQLKDVAAHSDIGHRMVKGAFWSLSGTVVAKLFVLISGILCAHILSNNEYGQFGMVRSTINLFVTLGSAGMGVTASKFISEYHANDKTQIHSIYCLTNGFAFITGLIITLIILIIAPYIATNILNSQELINPLRIGALLLFVTVNNGAQNGTLSGLEDFKAIAFNTLYGSLAESVFMLLGAYYGGVYGAVLGFGIGYLVIYVANHISIKRDFYKIGIPTSKFTILKEHFKILYTFSLPAALSSCMTAPVFFLVRAMLASHDGFEAVAIYEAADQWRTIVLFIPASIAQIVLPLLSSLSSKGADTYWKVLNINLVLNVTVATIVTLFVSICSPWIMRLYGSAYVSNYLTLVLLISSTIFTSAATVVGAALQSRAKTWTGLCFNILWALLTIFLTHIFLNKGLGANAISLAFLLSYMLHTLFQLGYLKYSFSIN